MAQSVADGLDGATGRHQVAAGQHATLRVDHDQVRADRADVHAEVRIDGHVAFDRLDLRANGVVVAFQRLVRSRIVLHVCFEHLQRGNAGVVSRFDHGKNGPDGAHRGEVFGHDQFAVFQTADTLERPHHARIGRHASVKRDGAGKLLALGDRALEVPRKGHAQARDDVVIRRGDLLEVDHVGLGEHAAASGDAGRVFGLQGQAAELVFDAHAQAGGLLVEKRSGPRGADRVHREVLHLQLAADRLGGQKDQLGVLAAKFDHRSHVRLQADRGLALGDDLVDEEGAQKVGDKLARRARNADPVQGCPRCPREHVPQHAPYRLDGTPARADIVLLGDGPVRGYQDGVDAH